MNVTCKAIFFIFLVLGLFCEGKELATPFNLKRNFDHFISTVFSPPVIKAFKRILLRTALCVVFVEALKKVESNQFFGISPQSDIRGAAQLGSWGWAPLMLTKIGPEKVRALHAALTGAVFANIARNAFVVSCIVISLMPEWSLFKAFIKAIKSIDKN